MINDATPEAAATGIIGLDAWGAHQGYGSSLDLQFGDARPDDPDRGAYHLWIYQCMWRIEHGSELGAGSEDAAERIATALDRLNGTAVTAIKVARPSLSTIFEFGESRLVTFATYTDASTDDPEQWMLFRPDRQVVSVGPGASWRLSPEDRP